MAIDQDLAAKGFRKLLILVGLLIASPLLLTVSFKALKLYFRDPGTTAPSGTTEFFGTVNGLYIMRSNLSC